MAGGTTSTRAPVRRPRRPLLAPTDGPVHPADAPSPCPRAPARDAVARADAGGSRGRPCSRGETVLARGAGGRITICSSRLPNITLPARAGHSTGRGLPENEPYRVSRRLQTLRDWSHEAFEQILPGASGTGSAVGPGPPGRAQNAMGSHRFGGVEGGLFGRDAVQVGPSGRARCGGSARADERGA